MEADLKLLRQQLREEDIDWRLQSVGKKQNGEWWAKIVPYADARMLMDRLDEACGPRNWQDKYRPGPDGGVLCALGIKIDGEWVWKEDGSENTEVESVKGGFTTAFRRAAVKWDVMGVRALYDVDGDIWANVRENGRCIARLGKKYDYAEFNYDPPNILSDPGNRGQPPRDEGEKKQPTGKKKPKPASRPQKERINQMMTSSKITPSERDGIVKKMKSDGTFDVASKIIDWLSSTIKERERVLNMDPDELDGVTIEVNKQEFTGKEWVEYYREATAESEAA